MNGNVALHNRYPVDLLGELRKKENTVTTARPSLLHTLSVRSLAGEPLKFTTAPSVKVVGSLLDDIGLLCHLKDTGLLSATLNGRSLLASWSEFVKHFHSTYWHSRTRGYP